jgi:glycosyltransferase involved in cell wall biosynthesis
VTESPSVSVVVCAYTEERWKDLTAAIDSCRAQTHVPLETIVVADHNPGLLERLRWERRDVLAVENDGQQGLSGARNSGARAARGEIVAFLDDDAVAAPDWLEFLVDAYVDADVIGVGGRIDPVWPEGRPAGLPPEFDWVVGCTYRGLPTERSAVRNMIGANMSLRSEVLSKIGGFRSGLGRIGNRPLGCEETELCIRALQRLPGTTILYEPRARVRHRVTPERTRWRYFHSRCYSEGLSKAAVASHAGQSDGLSSERQYALRTLPSAVLRSVSEALRGRELAGMVRGVAIVTGLLVTTLGYAVGLVRGAALAGGKA